MVPALLTMTMLALAGVTPAPDGRSAQQENAPGNEIVMQDVLAIERVGHWGRAPLHTDAIEKLLVEGRWQPPRVGDTVDLPDGSTRVWEKVHASSDGKLNHRALRGGYIDWPVELEEPHTFWLAASGHSVVYVNGVPRGGDLYSTGWARHPIALRAGTNDLLFACRRGRLRARLVEPRAPVAFNTAEATLPDLLAGETTPPWAGVLVVNSRDEEIDGWVIAAEVPGHRRILSPVPPMAPLSSRKVAFRIPCPAGFDGASVGVKLLLKQPGDAAPVDQVEISLRYRSPGAVHKRTFISAIDGSVQYYAVNPAGAPPDPATPPALVLSLHGAGVQATNQARSYASKPWCHIVAPTNRRPYGFDWEDWGRIDALEVLAQAQADLPCDSHRVYLTGHSMGGHGTWQVAAQYPGRFAAIGPSAGWISFWSYAGSKRPTEPSPAEALIQRAASPSDTLALKHNLAACGIYILHGASDDNVPPSEAREMVKQLGTFHHDFMAHEQPGAGHWWNASDEPGADCVDWPAMFDLFARHRLPATSSVREVEFTTANPAISATMYWATIVSQIHSLATSNVTLRADPVRRRFVGKTENVARLALDVAPLIKGESLSINLDEQSIEEIPWPADDAAVRLARTDGTWKLAGRTPPSLKNPRRCGPFKEAFRNHMVFVYGTHGNTAENAWCFAKARLDAETFWYRGNGSVDVVPDARFVPDAEPDRNVILYGRASVNTAWSSVLGNCPVAVGSGRLTVGSRTIDRDDLACLFTWPRRGSETALVGVVCGTGPVGERLTDRMPYFVSGVAYPDLTVLGPETLSQGAGGIVAAGFFGEDWGVDSGEIEWAE